MDIFRIIRNDTFGYGGITAKRSKHQERPLLMICSFSNCWYPEVPSSTQSTLQLLYLWDEKVPLSIASVLRTGSMGHLSKSPTTISKISSNFGKIGLKKMLGGVVLPPRTLFSPGVSFSQWTSQWLPRSWNWQKRLLSHCWPIHCHP